MRLAGICMLAAAALAQDAKPDPITDRMRYEIALAQRDYLSAKIQLDMAAAQLRTKLDAGNKACAAADKIFNLDTMSCADKAEKKP